ncbi:copper transporter [Corynebacterium sp. CCM 9185]|uniref:Copper transporter n=1 Tax=Corynebacterium marambiense TaxID=2765364 RepID=A0ABS0VXP4_9CORY|nr:copper transporter [Corynebacterium marambiense]MBI9000365.1 copper transporter [Corynebacterium marambiense]MCK7664115.1 copper transporter [Corynebacterium marambiense]
MAHTSQRRFGPLAGIFFGIAGGVALGACVLAPILPEGDSGTESITPAQLKEARLDAEIGAAQADTADAVVASVAEETVEGVLAGQSILLMTTPDAEQEDIENIAWLLGKAGAVDAGTVQLTEKFLNQEGADGLKTIVTSTLPAGAQLSLDRLDPGTHSGEALGSALFKDTATGEPQADAGERNLLLNALSEGGFLIFAQGTIQPADIIVIVTGDDDGSGDRFSAKNLATFATALDTRGRGVVLAGRVHAAADTGAIGVLRANADANAHVSTVDSIDRAYGRMATVLAARYEREGESGSYGSAASAEAAAPAKPTGPVREPERPADAPPNPEVPTADAPGGD